MVTSEDSMKVMEHFRDQACKMFTRWMYNAWFQYNAVSYESLGPAIEAMGNMGQEWNHLPTKRLESLY